MHFLCPPPPPPPLPHPTLLPFPSLSSLRWTEWIFSPSSSFAWLRLQMATKVSSSSFFSTVNCDVLRWWFRLEHADPAGWPWNAPGDCVSVPQWSHIKCFHLLRCVTRRVCMVPVSPVLWLWEDDKSVSSSVADLSSRITVTLIQHHCSNDYHARRRRNETDKCGGRMSEEESRGGRARLKERWGVRERRERERERERETEEKELWQERTWPKRRRLIRREEEGVVVERWWYVRSGDTREKERAQDTGAYECRYICVCVTGGGR